MIERITDPNKFKKVIADVLICMEEKCGSGYKWHQFLPFCKDSVVKAFGHRVFLATSFFCWANRTKDGHYDSLIIFCKNRDPKFNVDLFSEHTWYSSNRRVGFKLFMTAVKFARDNGYKYIVSSSVENSPNAKTVRSFYKRLGLLKDSETYIGKL